MDRVCSPAVSVTLGDGHSDRLRRSLTLHKHCETQPCAGRIGGHFRTVGLSLKFHPPPLLCTARGGKTNRSTCIKRSSRDREAGVFQASCPHTLETFWGIQEFKAALDFATLSLISAKQRGFFLVVGWWLVVVVLCSTAARLRGESCSRRQRTASWLCISRCLDTSGTLTPGRSS